MGVCVYILYILEMGEILVGGGRFLAFLEFIKIKKNVRFLMICLSKLGFGHGEQKGEKSKNESVCYLFYGIMCLSWWLFGGCVGDLRGRLRIFDIECRL